MYAAYLVIVDGPNECSAEDLSWEEVLNRHFDIDLVDLVGSDLPPYTGTDPIRFLDGSSEVTIYYVEVDPIEDLLDDLLDRTDTSLDN